MRDVEQSEMLVRWFVCISMLLCWYVFLFSYFGHKITSLFLSKLYDIYPKNQYNCLISQIFSSSPVISTFWSVLWFVSDVSALNICCSYWYYHFDTCPCFGASILLNILSNISGLYANFAFSTDFSILWYILMWRCIFMNK